MAADVRDLEVLREWLAALATYRADANESLTALRVEINRSIEWVNEQYHLWQRSIRKFDDAVVQAKADLAAKKFPDVNGRMPDTTVEERNLRRAVARLEHAQEQVEVCRKWLGTLPKLVDEIFHGPAQRLANLLDIDVPRGAAVLDRRAEALERYAEIRTDFSASGSLAPSPSEPSP
jgi:hypothetical protein